MLRKTVALPGRLRRRLVRTVRHWIPSGRTGEQEVPPPAPWPNTRKRNYEVWGQEYDWAQKGEEWTPSPEWKQGLINDVLLRWIGRNGTVLEIGPGGGRWTESLQQIAKRLVLVDLTEKSIDLCKQRFEGCGNIDYFTNDGKSLGFLPSESIDYVWSWDAFVHIDKEDTAAYMAEFARVLKPGASAVIHHPSGLDTRGGWRSAVTTAFFADLVRRNGLILIEQFDSWGDGKFDVHQHQDTISVFKK